MTLIYFILLLSVTVFIHELGHYIFAKRAGVYVYEFSIGMGPKLWSFKRKNDETEYGIRLFPIGGFVSMAGEEVNTDEDVPLEKRLYSKTWWQRFRVIVAGVIFNFIFALFLFFLIGLFNGAPTNIPTISGITEDYPISETSLEVGDVITHVDGKRIRSVDRLMLELTLKSGKEITIDTKDNKTIRLEPVKEEESYKYGFTLENEIEKGFLTSVKFAFTKTFNMLEQMVIVIKSLVTGELALNALSGPVGIYNVVGETAKYGFTSLVYLTAIISINVGFINLLPIPAFDGGRLLFMIIEKVRGKKVKPETENMFHNIGFVLLMFLMLFITFSDILKLT